MHFLRVLFLRCVRFLRPAVIACAAFCVAFFLQVLKEKGERQVRKIMPGKRPWVFSSRVIRADECGRSTRDPRFPSG